MYVCVYLSKILSKWQGSFCKGYRTRHSLLIITEKWRQCLDKGAISGTLFTDLSKAFECLLHDLLVAKLAAYDFRLRLFGFYTKLPLWKTTKNQR